MIITPPSHILSGNTKIVLPRGSAYTRANFKKTARRGKKIRNGECGISEEELSRRHGAHGGHGGRKIEEEAHAEDAGAQREEKISARHHFE